MGKWEMVRLGDVCDVRDGTHDSPKYVKDGYPLVTSKNVIDGRIDFADVNYISKEDFDKINQRSQVETGDIIMPMIGTIGKPVIVNGDTAFAIKNVALIKFAEDNASNIFIRYLLDSYLFKCYVEQENRGGTQKFISLGNIRKFPFPLPPLDEQKRIAKDLDLASEIVKGYKNQLAELDKLVQSVFYEMFGDIRANSKMWDTTPFSYCAKIDTRMTKDFAKYADYPHIGIDSIEKNTGNIVSCVLVKDSDLKSGKYLFDDRHLIYSKIRPNLNKVAKPNFEGICSADAYPLLPTKQCNREYLAMVLRSDSFLDYILAFSNRTNIPKVNKSQLESFSVPLPPIDLQTRFASIVTEIEAQKAQVQQALTEAENLFNSLMQEYFE